MNNTCKTAYIQIISMRHLLTTQTTQTLVCSLKKLFSLNYCNSLLSRCPKNLLDKLQKVQNAAALLVCKAKKSDHMMTYPAYSKKPLLATSDTPYSTQNLNHLLQCSLWQILSASFWSYTTIHSNQKTTFCIWLPYLHHPSCKHKTIWQKIMLLYRPICLE